VVHTAARRIAGLREGACHWGGARSQRTSVSSFPGHVDKQYTFVFGGVIGVVGNVLPFSLMCWGGMEVVFAVWH
jgi:hypothetical protein